LQGQARTGFKKKQRARTGRVWQDKIRRLQLEVKLFFFFLKSGPNGARLMKPGQVRNIAGSGQDRFKKKTKGQDRSSQALDKISLLGVYIPREVKSGLIRSGPVGPGG